ncbi:MAG: hypothetical protein ACO1OB_32070, partial [Archangium sp.]
MTQLRRVSLAALAILVAGCFEPNSDECSPGVVCPPDTRCSGDKTQCIGLNETCGNMVKEGDERCDDGNVRNGDECRADCKGFATCGDGNPDTDLKDDDGNQLELCDDGNNVSGDGCSADCKSTEVCGNSITDDERGEECDDGRDKQQRQLQRRTWRRLHVNIMCWGKWSGCRDSPPGIPAQEGHHR